MQSAKANLRVNIFDGSRRLIQNGVKFFIRLTDGNHKELGHTGFFEESSVFFKNLPFNNNFIDNYTVNVSSSNYVSAGFFPLKISRDFTQVLDIMLLHKNSNFNFQDATWDKLQNTHKELITFLSNDNPNAQNDYQLLMNTKPASLAALLNFIEALSHVHLAVGTPMNYLKKLNWDDSLAQDRFFAYADRDLAEQLEMAADKKIFKRDPALLHPEATRSFRQEVFSEANLQITLYERNTKTIGGVKCILVEVDIDYYSDALAHILLEVLPNSIGGGKTDPKKVYVLRWMAGRWPGVPEFNPPYTIT
jgi:hypothetical protein